MPFSSLGDVETEGLAYHPDCAEPWCLFDFTLCRQLLLLVLVGAVLVIKSLFEHSYRTNAVKDILSILAV